MSATPPPVLLESARSSEPYPLDPRAYLQDELSRVALLLRAYLLRVTSTSASDSATLPPACETVLREEFRWKEADPDPTIESDHAACVAAATRLDRQTVARMRRTRDEFRARFPAWELLRRFALVPDLASIVPRYKPPTPVETSEPIPGRDTVALDLLLLALLVDRFPVYRAAVAAVERDDESGALSAETALRIVQPNAGPADLRWATLAPTSPLLANDLIALRPTLRGGRSLLAIDPRVAAHILGEDPPQDPILGDAASVVHVWREWATIRLDTNVTEQLQRLSSWWWEGSEGATLAVLLHGPWGSPFLRIVQAFVTHDTQSLHGARHSRPIVVIDAAAGARVPDWDRFVRRAYREAVLRRGVVFWNQAEVLLSGDPAAAGRWEVLMRRAEQTGVATFFASRVGWDPADTFRSPRHYFVRVDLPIPSAPIRRDIWKTTLKRERNPVAEDSAPPERLALDLLESFEFTQGEIEDAIATARGLAMLAPPVPDDVKASQSAEWLAEACRRQAARRPVSFSRRMTPRLSAEDLAGDPKEVLRRRVILPGGVGQQIGELYDRMTNISRVYRDLAFEQRLSLGRGLLVLFAGQPGTGKTLAATTLAGLLRKDLYRVDTAAVVSRLVGETEKNLGRVFADVQSANAILFFDEADALFGRRGDVVQAADRWANMQISYLLQRVEEFTGTVILATNLRDSIDPAFFRRFQVLVDFPRPDSAGRLAILHGMVEGTAVSVADGNGRIAKTPDEVRAVLRPVTDRFDLTGGNLKNVLLDATFRAVTGATNGPPILMTRDLVLGVAREYQKDGKPVSVATFGKEWFGLVERELSLGRG